MTETFVAAKLYVDNWRWADTPFYVRMGKRLPRRETTIAIQFKRAPHPPFEEIAVEGLRPNVLLIHVQPDEGLSLAIGAKVPGQGMSIRTVHMDFLYGSAFRDGLPEAYERLILDAMLGDATLFTRAGRDRGAVGARRRDRRRLAARPAGVPELRGRHLGPAVGRRAAPPRRPLLAAPLMAAPRSSRSGRATDVSIAEIERELARLRASRADEGGQPHQRTSVMTHIAWVPPDGSTRPSGRSTGMAERHPSRTVILVPRPGRARTGSTRELSVRCFPRRRPGRLRRGDRAAAPRRPRRGARVDRAAARDLRPAGVPALARRAAVRRDAVGAARRRRRPA